MVGFFRFKVVSLVGVEFGLRGEVFFVYFVFERVFLFMVFYVCFEVIYGGEVFVIVFRRIFEGS